MKKILGLILVVIMGACTPAVDTEYIKVFRGGQQFGMPICTPDRIDRYAAFEDKHPSYPDRSSNKIAADSAKDVIEACYKKGLQRSRKSEHFKQFIDDYTGKRHSQKYIAEAWRGYYGKIIRSEYDRIYRIRDLVEKHSELKEYIAKYREPFEKYKLTYGEYGVGENLIERAEVDLAAVGAKAGNKKYNRMDKVMAELSGSGSIRDQDAANQKYIGKTNLFALYGFAPDGEVKKTNSGELYLLFMNRKVSAFFDKQGQQKLYSYTPGLYIRSSCRLDEYDKAKKMIKLTNCSIVEISDNLGVFKEDTEGTW